MHGGQAMTSNEDEADGALLTPDLRALILREVRRRVRRLRPLLARWVRAELVRAMAEATATLTAPPAAPETAAAPDGPAALLLRHIALGRLGERFTAREVYLKHWTGLGQSAVKTACQNLVAAEVLTAESTHRRGRPTTIYVVNRAALKAYHQGPPLRGR